MVVRSRITGGFRPGALTASKSRKLDAERRAGAAKRAEQKEADDRANIRAIMRNHKPSPKPTMAPINLPEVGDD